MGGGLYPCVSSSLVPGKGSEEREGNKNPKSKEKGSGEFSAGEAHNVVAGPVPAGKRTSELPGPPEAGPAPGRRAEGSSLGTGT